MTEAYRTLAHEFQHIVNYTYNGLFRDWKPLDSWINEGLSSAAEVVCFGPSSHRLATYNQSVTIRTGNNFFVWDNDLDDYATVYLFFQWLRIHNNNNIFYNIIKSNQTNYLAVVDNVDNVFNGSRSWENLLETWLAANYIKSPSGVYGYQGQINPVARYAPIGTVDLLPGEGFYSKTGSTAPSLTGSGTNIKNVYLYNGQTNDAFSSNIALLSFNSNTNKAGLSETGIHTGLVASNVPAMNVVPASNLQDSTPIPIGMGRRFIPDGNEEIHPAVTLQKIEGARVEY